MHETKKNSPKIAKVTCIWLGFILTLLTIGRNFTSLDSRVEVVTVNLPDHVRNWHNQAYLGEYC